VARGISGIIFENPRFAVEICGLQVDIEQEHGPFCNVAWISGFWIYFPIKNLVDRAARLGSTVDRGGADTRARWHLVGAWHAGAMALRCLPAVVDEDEAVMQGCSLEHEQQWRGSALVKKTSGGMGESAKSMEESGRCGNDRGWGCPFIGGRGAPGRW
jgi:hypothetical protein